MRQRPRGRKPLEKRGAVQHGLTTGRYSTCSSWQQTSSHMRALPSVALVRALSRPLLRHSLGCRAPQALRPQLAWRGLCSAEAGAASSTLDVDGSDQVLFPLRRLAMDMPEAMKQAYGRQNMCAIRSTGRRAAEHRC